MIDMETEIFNEVSAKVQDQYPDIFMTGEYAKTPSSFPCASLVEVDNATFRNTQTTESKENHVAVMYELNVYSTAQKGKRLSVRKSPVSLMKS